MPQSSPPASPATRSPLLRLFGSRSRLWLTVLLFVVGVAICVLLAVELGAESVRATLRDLAHLLPPLLVLELFRFGSELFSTRLVLRGTPVPWLLLLQGQCAAHACNHVLPAGRTAGEGLKAALLVPACGGAKAIGVGAAGQIMTLLVNGTLALIAALVAWYGFEAERESLIFGSYGVLVVLLGVGAVASLRSVLLDALLRRFRATAGLQQRVREMAESGAGFGVGALLWQYAARLCQVLQLGLLLYALGRGIRLDLALVAGGVQLVGAAAGDLLPAHMGATEGAFTLTAALFGLTASAALSLAVVMHVTQLLFAGLATVALFILRMVQHSAARRPTTPAAGSTSPGH